MSSSTRFAAALPRCKCKVDLLQRMYSCDRRVVERCYRRKGADGWVRACQYDQQPSGKACSTTLGRIAKHGWHAISLDIVGNEEYRQRADLMTVIVVDDLQL